METSEKYCGVCIWCREDLFDGAEASGWTGEGPDVATLDRFGFDFGCDQSPETGSEGVGSHATMDTLRRDMRLALEASERWRYYLVVMHGGLEASLVGPWDSEEARDAAALETRENQDEDDTIHALDATHMALKIGDYSGGFFMGQAVPRD